MIQNMNKNMNKIIIEIAYADKNKQILISYKCDPGDTAYNIILNSGIFKNINQNINQNIKIGEWSKPISLDKIINHNTRLEVYRDLECDPKLARKSRALVK